MSKTTLQLRPLSSGLGAEVSGIDLAAPLDDATFAAVEQAWREHLILLFRGQALTHRQHVDFSARFGPLDDHASIPRLRDPSMHHILPVTNQEVAGRRQPVGRQWHTDLSTTLHPARGSLLRCEEIPPVGGDTMFSNMYLAYETLSDTMKDIIDDLWAVHDLTRARHNIGRPDIAEVRRNTPPVAHPMVRVHPETGRRALYVNEMVTADIVGLRREEARPILDFLFAHSVRPEFTYRHRWQVGDMIAWDNRCTMHLALDDYDLDVPRRLYRTTLLGEPSGYLLEKEELAA
jgi:taurine dioxygenase